MEKIVIEYNENGPYLVKRNGQVETALCRCGGTRNKPYCDGTHSKTGFKAPKGKIELSK